ncbi:hypothetical protein R1flu_003421 [Riccia fluitans]|uniref:Uncharacterized protein n=1 Tax=Riccia fluitans TaxID=41844 RepID=A0ABD1Y910_9MARC
MGDSSATVASAFIGAASTSTGDASTFIGVGSTGPTVNTPLGVVPTPTSTDIIGILQTLATLIRQQSAGEREDYTSYFLDWIEQQPGRVMDLSELLREFERRYNQLLAIEKLSLETRRTELFLRAADDVSTDRLCFMLANRMVEAAQPIQQMPMDVPQQPAAFLGVRPAQVPTLVAAPAPVPRAQRRRDGQD